MKKILSVFLIISMLLLCNQGAFAKENEILIPNNLGSLSKNEIFQYKKLISSLSDKEFDMFVVEYLQNKDFNDAKNELALIGVEIQQVIAKPNAKNRALLKSDPHHLDAWEVDVSVYTTKRIGDNFYRIHGQVDFSDYEDDNYCGTYDVIGIFWDSNKADYYGYSVLDSNMNSLKDFTQKDNGTVLFNLYDTRATWLTTSVVAVYVTPTVDNEWIDIGIKYTHTFRESESTYHGSASIQFGGLGEVSGAIGYEVTYSTYETGWDISDTNAFKP